MMTNKSFSITYPYKMKKSHLILIAVVFGYLTWISALEALNNQESLTYVLYQNVIELTFNPTQATFILWIQTVLKAFGCFYGLYATYLTYTSKSQIVLTETSIFIPGQFSQLKNDRTILFEDLDSLRTFRLYKITILMLVGPKVKVSIQDSMLPKKYMLDEIRHHIEMRIRNKAKTH